MRLTGLTGMPRSDGCQISQSTAPRPIGTIGIPEGWTGRGRRGKEVIHMAAKEIPLWEKYTMTIEEAARYFRIGEGKLRRLAEERPRPEWVVMNGNRVQIKRVMFERFIDATDVI